MKLLFLLPFFGIAMLTDSSNPVTNISAASKSVDLSIMDSAKGLLIGSQAEPVSQRMAVAVFKSQQYCRAELKDFEFDAHFIIQSATVYFTGTNFSAAAKGTITSSSLKPISNFMQKCAPGTIVMFDDVKVIGPDKQARTIPGITITLF